MNANPPKSRDEAAEQTIGILLRTGVTVAALVVFVGGVLLLLQAPTRANYSVFHGEPTALEHVSQIIPLALHLDPQGVIQLGLLLLIATPVARVAFSVWAFARERDWMYVGITLMVLVLLLASLFGV